MAIDITKIIIKQMTNRPIGHIPLCVKWLYEQIGKPRNSNTPNEGVWCGRGWVINNVDGRYVLECVEISSEQRFSLIWL